MYKLYGMRAQNILTESLMSQESFRFRLHSYHQVLKKGIFCLTKTIVVCSKTFYTNYSILLELNQNCSIVKLGAGDMGAFFDIEILIVNYTILFESS